MLSNDVFSKNWKCHKCGLEIRLYGKGRPASLAQPDCHEVMVQRIMET
jgi:hypothetical protein